jgi:hypothetical protein
VPRVINRKFLKSLQIGILVALLSTVFSLLLIELIVRLGFAISKTDKPRYQEHFDSQGLLAFDSEIGWIHKKNYQENSFIVTDEEGFRNASNIWKTSSVKKALVLGDSMPFGFGMRQDKIFSETINNESQNWRIANAAVTAYSTGQEYLLLKRLLKTYKPDLIVLFFTQENDVLTNVRNGDYYPTFSLYNDQLIFNSAGEHQRNLFKKYSLAWRILDSYFLQGRDFDFLHNRLDLSLRGKNSYAWRVTAAILHAIKKECDLKGVKLIVVDIPSQNQLKSDVTDSDYREIMLRDFLRGISVDYYSLRTVYPMNYRTIFLENDSHWNEEGHALVAKFMLDLLDANADQ